MVMASIGIGFVGFGEAGNAFFDGLSKAMPIGACAYDRKFRENEYKNYTRACSAKGVVCLQLPDAGLKDAALIFCLVTADQAHDAARACAPHLTIGQFWFDGNSCSPGSKRQSAELMARHGVKYVDLAIMAPVHPKLHYTPCLISGGHAEEALALMAELGMDAKYAGDKVGDASAIKMMRSVMVKGMEALTAECLLAARKAGVDEAVLQSLIGSDPAMDWMERSAYNLERMMVHGVRRAAEMREVAATLRELGMPDHMAAATVEWQQAIGDLRLQGGAPEFESRAERILEALK